MLAVGEKAPDFLATGGAAGEKESLSQSSFAGKNVVLFFYPGDFTTVCTKEACAFRDYNDSFEKHNAVVVGVSPDDAESHRKFAGHYKLSYPLISDPEGKLAEQYGLKRMFSFMPPKRATFVIDSTGVIRGVIHKELDYNGHVDGALKVLSSL